MAEHVLDANVFIHATDLNVRFEDPLTVPAVVEELESREAGERYERSGVDVYEPGGEAVDAVEAAADEKGEDLSDADVQVLALALDRGSTVVTDDYGVQNVAEAFDIAYEPFHQEGIDEEITWRKVCESCGAAVEGERCGRCGGEPKRVPADS